MSSHPDLAAILEAVNVFANRSLSGQSFDTHVVNTLDQPTLKRTNHNAAAQASAAWEAVRKSLVILTAAADAYGIPKLPLYEHSKARNFATYAEALKTARLIQEAAEIALGNSATPTPVSPLPAQEASAKTHAAPPSSKKRRPGAATTHDQKKSKKLHEMVDNGNSLAEVARHLDLSEPTQNPYECPHETNVSSEMSGAEFARRCGAAWGKQVARSDPLYWKKTKKITGFTQSELDRWTTLRKPEIQLRALILHGSQHSSKSLQQTSSAFILWECPACSEEKRAPANTKPSCDKCSVRTRMVRKLTPPT